MWSSNISSIVIVLLIVIKWTDSKSCDISISRLGNNSNDIDIHIIGFFPCTDPNDTRGIPVDNCDGIERQPIMELALKEINGRCDLLPGYRLVVDYANSACASVPATYHLIQQTDPSQPTKLMILGPACSVATELMGEIAQRFMNITQVAYTSSSLLFGMDKQSYPRFYRLAPTTKEIADGYVVIVKKLGWRRVVIISHDSVLYHTSGVYIAEQLTSSRVLIHLSFTHGPTYILNTIKVIKEKLVGPDFVWMLPGWYEDNWWAAVDGTDCTAEEMGKALEHSVGARGNGKLDHDLSRVLVSNKNVTQFEEDLEANTTTLMPENDIFLDIDYVYDAAWTIALALNSSISILEERGLGRLEDFTYENVEIADVFTQAVLNTTFQGISGKVSFQENGNRKNPLIAIVQYRNGDAVRVMIYNNTDGSDNFIELPGQSLMWQGGYVPKDAPSPKVQGDKQFETIIAATATSLGIVSIIYFFTFNICHRNTPAVKRSSYRLNSLILAAALVGFIGTLLHVIPLDSDMSHTSTAAICNIRKWMRELGFSVCFATFFVKIWRLYKVFCNKQLAELKFLKDQHLLVMIAIIVAPILLVLIIQVVFFPLTLHVYTEIDEDDPGQQNVFYRCEGKHSLIFDGLLFIGDIILGLLNAMVAFQTKKHLPEDNNYSKYHESAVINLTTMMAILLSSICEVITVLFQTSNKGGTLLLITLRECSWLYPAIYLLFIPKVYRVYRGILVSRKQTRIKKDTVQCHSLPAGENASARNKFQNGRRRLSNESTTSLIVSDNTSKQDKPDHSRQTTNSCIDTDPAQYDVTDNSDVRVFITRVEVVNDLHN